MVCARYTLNSAFRVCVGRDSASCSRHIAVPQPATPPHTNCVLNYDSNSTPPLCCAEFGLRFLREKCNQLVDYMAGTNIM